MTLLACEMSAVVWCLVAQLCLTLCDPMDCSPPGSSVYGVTQSWTRLKELSSSSSSIQNKLVWQYNLIDEWFLNI